MNDTTRPAGIPDLNKAITDTLLAAIKNMQEIMNLNSVKWYPKTLAALRSVPDSAQRDYAIPLIQYIFEAGDVDTFDLEQAQESSYLDTSISVCVSDLFQFLINQENERLQAEARERANGQSTMPGIMMPTEQKVDKTGLIK